LLRRKWVKKREFIVYYYLYRKTVGRPISIHDAIFEVKKVFNYNTKTSRNIIKRIIKMSLADKIEVNKIMLRNPDEVLNDYLVSFLSHRRKLFSPPHKARQEP